MKNFGIETDSAISFSALQLIYSRCQWCSNHSVAPVVLIIALALTACGGGEGNGDNSTSSSSNYLIAGEDGNNYFGSPTDGWTTVPGIASSYDARGVAYGNGTYVWVGDCGTGCYASAVSSTSLTNALFTITNFGGFSTAYEVAFGNGVFVAVGFDGSDSRTWVSSDGKNWTQSTVSGVSSIFKITFGNGIFMAGCGTSICTSTDGSTWSKAPSPGGYDVREVAYGNGKFLAIGSDNTPDPNNNVYASMSTDGSSWSTPVALGNPGGAFYDIGGAAYGNGTWVIAGDDEISAHTWVSINDGASWSSLSLVGTRLKDVVFASGQFVIVGETAHITASTDGINWSNHDIPSGGGWLNAINYKP